MQINDAGCSEATRNGTVLKQVVTQPHEYAFVSSPLRRTTQTLELIRATMTLPPRRYSIDDRIIDLDAGSWEGMTNEEVAANDPDALRKHNDEGWDFRPPGGESYREAAIRVRQFLVDLDRPAIIVSHAWIGKLIRGYLRGLGRRRTSNLELPHDKVFKINRGRETVL